MPEGSDHEDVIRLRDWRHQVVTPELAALRERESELRRRMDAIEPKVERMARADEIADAVSERLHERREVVFTVWQKVGAALVGGIAIADFVRSLVMG